MGLVVLSAWLPGWSSETSPERSATKPTVYLLGSGLSDENVICLTANIAAGGNSGVVLIDSPKFNQQQKQFLQEFQAERVVPVGTFTESVADLKHRLAGKVS